MKQLYIKLDKINKELEKCRTSSFIDGWQTQKHSKKSRKWDELAREKFEVVRSIQTLEGCNRGLHNDDIFNFGICSECGEHNEKISFDEFD